MRAPNGWRRTTLGELGNYFNGRGFKKSEWRESGRPIIRIQNLTGSGESFNYYQGEVEERYVARPGDLLVSWAATLGAYFWSGPEAVVNQHIFKVESNIDRRFHKYLLDYKLGDLMRHTHGSGMVHITRGRFDSEPVNVPIELREQRRIVEILEDHLSHLDAADREIGLARTRLDALLLTALRAHVTQMNEAETPFERIGDLTATKLGKMLDAKKTTGEPTPYLANISVRWGRFDLDHLKSVPLTADERDRLTMQPGDVIVCEGGEPGRCAVWDRENSGIAYQKALHRVRVQDPSRIEPEYLALMLREAVQSGRADRLFTGTTIKHLPQEKLRMIEIPLPEMSVQGTVLGEFGAISEATERLDVMLQSTVARGNALRRAVLAAAFEGKLTGRHTDTEVIEELAYA